MALLLALVRSHGGGSAALLHTARCMAGAVAGPDALFSTVFNDACTCSTSSALSTAAAAAAQQQQHLSTSYAVLPAQWNCHRTFFSQFTKPDSKVYKERRLLGYSPEQLYEVVSSVQHYHQFVPWCVGSHVLKRAPDGSYLEAELQIGFQMISERYTSRVKLQAPHLVSSTVADSALFHHLESTWQLKPGPNPNSTWLSFSVDFAFLNPLYANIAHLFFSEVVTRMMGAFEGRCKQLYGPPSFSPAGQRHIAQQQQHHHKQQQHHHHHHHLHRMPPAVPPATLLHNAPAAAGAVVPGSSAAAQTRRPQPWKQTQQQQQQQQPEDPQ